MVRGVHRRVEQHMRHGAPRETAFKHDKQSGMIIYMYSVDVLDSFVAERLCLLVLRRAADDSVKRFFGYFKEEIRDQFRGKPPNKL